ncbi:MAG: cysteine desulfurase [Rhodobacteraceae bacterium]|nr:cysteine desulfurase [Rhodobacterales bacterium]NCX86184.1 cysteine desulfurase [Paracoccaceae bacterium]
MLDYFWLWSEMIVRWVHVIAGVAWIGSSFYFIALDLSLKPGKELPKEANGQAWQVHGGGFYNMVKYLVAPKKMPEELTWFKWEAYSTWISGMALMSLVYYGSASLYMIDLEVLDITQLQAVFLSLGGIVIGWIIYDGLCRSPLGKNDLILALAGLVFLVLLSFIYTQVFSHRGAFMQMGVTIGTMMVANVAMVIIPGQKKVVQALKAGDDPNPIYGVRGKQRSLHNNYLTLPVIFVMIGGHYPIIFATEYSWLILGLILIIGALIRHFFNTKHKGLPAPYWTWLVASILTVCSVLLSYAGAPNNNVYEVSNLKMTKEEIHKTAVELVIERCSSCHAREPLWEGLAFAPKGIHLETEEEVLKMANEIYWQSAASWAMPPGNIIWLEDEERVLLSDWHASLKKN